jgi:hypothetical protein
VIKCNHLWQCRTHFQLKVLDSDGPPVKYVYKRRGKSGNVNEIALVLEGQREGNEAEIGVQEAGITECTGGKRGLEDQDWGAKENPISKGKEKEDGGNT